MKTFLKSTVLATVLLSTTQLSADFLRIEGGAGVWAVQPSGYIDDHIKTGTPVGNLTYHDDVDNTQTLASPYAWIYFKHFVPIIPNVRLEYLSLGEYNGNSKLTSDTLTNTFGINEGAHAKSLTNVNEYDAVLYYNILDNTFWTTIDLGVDVKVLDLRYRVESATVGTQKVNALDEQQMVPVPMGYARARVQIPFSGFAFEASGKYLAVSGSEFYDAFAKVDYTFTAVPVVQPGLEVGYRAQKIHIDESSVDVKADLDFRGIFAGLMLRF